MSIVIWALLVVNGLLAGAIVLVIIGKRAVMDRDDWEILGSLCFLAVANTATCAAIALT